MSGYPPVRILADDLIRTATLSASPALASNLGADYLKTVDRTQVARSTSTLMQSILGDFDAARLVDCVVLWRHNLTEDSTWRVRLYAAPGRAGTPLVDTSPAATYSVTPLGSLNWGVDPLGGATFSDWVQPANHAVLYLPEPVSIQSFRIDLNDAANPAGFVQASRLMMGKYWEPTQNADYGFDFQWVEATTLKRSGANSLRSDGRAPVRQLGFDFSRLDPAEAAQLLRIIMRNGRRAEMWVSLYPAWGALDADFADQEYLHSFVGKLSNPHGSTSRTWRQHADRLVFEEI